MSDVINIFISYNHNDEQYANEIKRHFTPWKSGKQVNIWTEKEILSGQVWEQEIIKNLQKSDVIIMLLSANFFASNFTKSEEFALVLEKHKKKEALAIGILVTPCKWEDTDLASFQLFPLGAKPIASHKAEKREEIYKQMIQKIMDLVETSLEAKKSADFKPLIDEYSEEGITKRTFKIPLPWQEIEEVDVSFFLKALPHFTEHLYIFTKRSIKLIDEHRKGYEKHPKEASSIDNAEKLQNFLQILCREVNSVFFTWGGVRTHFRYLHIDKNQYLRFAVAFSDIFDEEYALSEMPRKGDKVSMINKSAELKVPLIYSVNKDKGWHSGDDPAKREDFTDYVTFVLMDNTFMYQGKYLLSMGISFAKPELHRNLYYILTLSRFDDIVASIVKSFAEALNIDVVDAILKSRNSINESFNKKK